MNREAISNLRFLVVEDQDFQREALVMLLTSIGANHIQQAENGSVALDLLLSESISADVVICDLDMPQMDGMALIRNIAQKATNVSVILVSGLDRSMLDSVSAMAMAYNVRLLGAMAKPCSRSQLTALVSTHFERKIIQKAASPTSVISQLEIAQGLKNVEFIPYFQPKIEMASGSVIGVEALARWNSPTRGLLPPGVFLDAVESYGFMDSLTWIILARSAAVCRQWQEQGLDLIVSVNLSLSSVGRPELAERVYEVVTKQGVEPSSIILEVTETAAMSALGPSLENLTRLRMRGFGLSIDDYGTGYSSMQQLTRVPFSELKIDQSFVKVAREHDATRIVVESSVAIAHKLNLHATAEGIETPEQWEMLAQMGCDVAQGYLIAKPMPEAEIPNWVRNWSKSSVIVPQHSSTKVDILLVEDEDFQRETYSELLVMMGLGRVDAAHDVDSALQFLEASSYDLIITDVELVGRSGLDLIRMLRTNQTKASPGTRVLLLSSHSEREIIFRSIALDINGFITKPSSSRVLKESIFQALREEFFPQYPEMYLETTSTDQDQKKQHISASILMHGGAPPLINEYGTVKKIPLILAKPGMILADSICTKEGVVLLSKGKTLTSSIVNRLLDIQDHLAEATISIESTSAVSD